MRTAIFVIALFVFALSIISVTRKRKAAEVAEQDKQLTTPLFLKTLIDVGDKKLKSHIEATYTVYNKGSANLYIEDVRPDCHCTVASFSKDPVTANDSSQITLKYDSSIPGVFQSSAIVTTNSSSSPTILILRGNVVE